MSIILRLVQQGMYFHNVTFRLVSTSVTSTVHKSTKKKRKYTPMPFFVCV